IGRRSADLEATAPGTRCARFRVRAPHRAAPRAGASRLYCAASSLTQDSDGRLPAPGGVGDRRRDAWRHADSESAAAHAPGCEAPHGFPPDFGWLDARRVSASERIPLHDGYARTSLDGALACVVRWHGDGRRASGKTEG